MFGKHAYQAYMRSEGTGYWLLSLEHGRTAKGERTEAVAHYHNRSLTNFLPLRVAPWQSTLPPLLACSQGTQRAPNAPTSGLPRGMWVAQM